ncbi:hypothetical protein Tco_0641841 [Tanacetum coccineum]|uniref:Uncharacterized protein n=1 Tax=Tanacetum coccineum TaxID=301880 RepID=A0ABQ5FS55_9ASTR
MHKMSKYIIQPIERFGVIILPIKGGPTLYVWDKHGEPALPPPPQATPTPPPLMSDMTALLRWILAYYFLPNIETMNQHKDDIGETSNELNSSYSNELRSYIPVPTRRFYPDYNVCTSLDTLQRNDLAMLLEWVRVPVRCNTRLPDGDWKTFDMMYPGCAKEPKKCRLGSLKRDGMYINGPESDTYRASYRGLFSDKNMLEESLQLVLRRCAAMNVQQKLKTTGICAVWSPGGDNVFMISVRHSQPNGIVKKLTFETEKTQIIGSGAEWNDLRYCLLYIDLHIDGESTEVDAPPGIIDVPGEDDDISDDKDPLPHDLADSNVEDLINDDDGVLRKFILVK